jgi:hypothetical protein
MARKVFKASRRAENDKIGFTIEPFKLKEDGSTWPNVDFDCQDSISAGALMAFSGEDTPEGTSEQERGRQAIQSTKQIFNESILESQHKVFWEMVAGEHGGLDIDQMMQLAEYLAGEYGSRPTGESSVSGQPATSSSTASTDGASPGVTIYSSSPRPAL